MIFGKSTPTEIYNNMYCSSHLLHAVTQPCENNVVNASNELERKQA